MEFPFRNAPAEEQERILFYLAVTMGAVLLLVFAVLVFNRWLQKRTNLESELPTPNDMLTEFRRLREQGLMSEAEFERVKRKLGNQIRAAAGQSPLQEEKLPPLPMEDSDAEFEWEDVDLKSLDEPPTNSKST